MSRDGRSLPVRNSYSLPDTCHWESSLVSMSGTVILNLGATGDVIDGRISGKCWSQSRQSISEKYL